MATTKATLTKVSVEALVAHPDNPRVMIREDVVSAIVANLDGEFPQHHAMHARPVEDVFQILSGHQRLEAARRKGLKHVWAWIEEMDDAAAFMLLVTSNNQGELSPLEIGIHALKAVPKSEGGRGKKGGLSEYAAKIGKHRPNVVAYRNAAEVATNVSIDRHVFLDRAGHLAAIHKLPRACWQAACEWLACVKPGDDDKKAGSVADVEKRVTQAVEFHKAFDSGDWGRVVPRAECTAAVFCGTDPGNFSRLVSIYQSVSDHIAVVERELLASVGDDKSLDASQKKSRCEFLKAAVESIGEEWVGWLIENRGGDSWKIAAVQDKRILIEQKLWDLQQNPPTDVVSLILADPPWKYDFAETDNRKIENQYPSATVEEICTHVNAPWAPKLADDCVLFLWATAPKLLEALKVMGAWGFEYKTHAVWDKGKIGMGYWFRGQHELLLVGTRGEMSPPEQSQRVSSMFRESRSKHSKKPECVYAAIESMFPDSVRCEFYQRNSREGWIGVGNEA